MRDLFVEAIGAGAAICSVTSFVPQLVKLVREKDARAVSLHTCAVTVAGFSLWLIYGICRQSWPLIAANTISLLLSGAVLVLKLHYKRRDDAETAPLPRGSR